MHSTKAMPDRGFQPVANTPKKASSIAKIALLDSLYEQFLL